MGGINPFCDSDIRNGMQFLSGVNLILIVICLIADALAIVEIEQFSTTWNPSSFLIPVYIGLILLCCDIVANVLLFGCGWGVYSSISTKTYGKINKFFYVCLVLFIIELGLLISYFVCIPSSPFFYYFTLLSNLYKGYFLWPMKKFINDYSHDYPQPYRAQIQQPPPTERTRLLASVA